MQKSRLKLLVAVVACLLATSVTQASIVFDNGLAANDVTSGYFSSELQNWRVYDDFSLGSASTIDRVFFQMGLSSGPFNGSFTFSIYNYLGGNNIGSLIQTTTLAPGQYTATANAISSYPYGPFYDISFDYAGITLGAGNYAVSFYGLGSMDFRTPNTGSGNSFYQQFGANTVNTREGNTPFRLENVAPVPEPSTYLAGALLALVFGVQGFRSLRSRKQTA